MAEYDTLQIKIEADSKQANASIKSLSANLKSLDDRAKELDTKRLIEVKGLLQSIAKIDFSNVVKGLQSVVSAFKTLNNKTLSKAVFSGSGANLQVPPQGERSSYEPNWEMKSWAYSNDTSLTVIKEMRGEVEALNEDLTSNAKTWQETIEGINKQLPTVFRSAYREEKVFTETLEEALGGIGLNGEQIKMVMSSIRSEIRNIDPSKLEDIRAILIKFGASAEQADNIIKSLAKSVDNAGKKAQKSMSGFHKLINQFNKIIRYRIIRKIIQEIYKALTEGIQNIATYDAGVKDSLSRLTSAFSYLKNSIGAMFAPLIQIVTPILEAVMMIVGELANTFAEFFSAMNGQDTFSKATYDLKEYNKEAKKTQALGIDELNVIGQDQSGGFTTEQVQKSTEMNELASALKDTIGKIKELLGGILGSVKEVLTTILPKITELLKPITEIIGNIITLVNKFLVKTNTSASNLLGSVIGALSSIFNIISSIVEGLMPALEMVVEIIAEVVNLINDVLGAIIDCVANILDGIKPIIQALVTIVLPVVTTILAVVTTILEVVKAIVETLVYLATFQWHKIGDVWRNAGSSIGGAWDKVDKVFSGKAYASGGFPEDGLFFANHNELVGQFSNGKTVVANNQQITQGIYDAVLQAMRESGGKNQEVVINLDGNTIARVVTEKQKNFGADLVVGGNVKWGT